METEGGGDGDGAAPNTRELPSLTFRRRCLVLQC